MPGILDSREMRILMIIPTLACGGAERTAVRLGRGFADLHHEVRIVKLDGDGDRPFFDLDPRIELSSLGILAKGSSAKRLIFAALLGIKRLRHEVKAWKPDVIISHVNGASHLAILSGLRQFAPLIAVEHTTPEYYSPIVAVQSLRTALLRYATRVVTVSKHACQFYVDRGVTNALYIPNPLEVSPQHHLPRDAKDLRIVALGRLHQIKGFDLLIDAFSRIAPRHPEVSLTIWGEGLERKALESQIAQCGLSRQILLPGSTNAPLERLAEGDIFVLPSRAEGFPHVLAEAMSVGLPVIAFDCHSGPAELINHNVNGLLVAPQDVSSLASHLSALLDDFEMRKRFASAARIVDKLTTESLMPQWSTLLQHHTKH